MRLITDIKDQQAIEWLSECRHTRGWARQTLQAYVYSLIEMEMYATKVSLVKFLRDWDYDDYRNFVAHYVKNNASKNSVALYIKVAKAYQKWRIDKGYITEDEYPLHRPLKLTGLRDETVTVLLPPLELLKLRVMPQKTTTLMDAAILETALCTGMRRSELVQLRASDIRWGEAPIDIELQAKSPYVAATVYLDPFRHGLKNDKARRCYISQLAGDLIRRVLKSHGISLDSNLPVFPMTPYEVRHRIAAMARSVNLLHPESYVSAAKELGVQTATRFGMMDINSEEIENNELRAAIQRLQRIENKERQQFGLRKNVIAHAEKKARNIRKTLNPHALRYTNVCIMYHRHFTGHRHDLDYVSRTTGHSLHSGQSDVIEKYLAKFSLVESDSQWRNLWTNKATYWAAVK